MLKKLKKLLPIIVIFFFALFIRILSTYPANIILGFDQARDFFDTIKIIRGDLRIVGPTAGNNANLHHGVAFLYYLIPPMILGKANPFWLVFWNSIFNSLTAVILFFFSQSIFKNKKAATVSAILASISFYLVQYSSWLSNPTVTLFTVPVFFFYFWLYKKGFKLGLPISLFFLGLSIQFEIFFLYLIPIFLILWICLKIKIPKIRTVILSFLSFCLATSTMIATEIKFNFSGVKSLILSSGNQQEVKNQYLKEFIERFFDTFSETLIPNKNLGVIAGILLIVFLLFEIAKKKTKGKDAFIFLTIYLLSPLIMFLVGYHKAPWFLIGLPPAILLIVGYFLSKLKNILLIPIIFLIAFFNLSTIKKNYGQGQVLLEPDSSALLSRQLEVIDYTYQKSEGKPFSINTVTNPLYINAIWAYNYSWYSNKYGYLPTWLGGDQEYPYNTLSEPEGDEEMFFLIIDNSGRIPLVHKLEAEKWAEKQGKLVETKNLEGIIVDQYLFK